MSPRHRRRVVIPAIIGLVMSLFSMFGCGGMPLAEQEQKIRNNDLVLRKLEARAFVRAWGQPTYQHMEFTPFFGMKDGSLVPRSRLHAGEALFLAYPDHGWLVVFLDEVFVYREELPAEKLHEIGRTWAHEDKFRTSIEKEQRP